MPKSVKRRIKKSFPETNFERFPIIGIGSSAGGLETLEHFFKNMPANSGMAFIIIQHLAPTHIGYMPELLQRATSMNVFQVTDLIKVMPNCIYVIPPSKSMSILNGVLHLSDLVKLSGLRLPIDFFFRSLAEDMQERSIVIILSGMGSDGSLGAKAIKEKSGIVLVQDPLSAKYDGMPRSATEAVNADIVAPVTELPGKLIACLKYKPVVDRDQVKYTHYKGNLEKIIILLLEQSGHDFSLYKKNTLFRRIERRMNVNQIDRIYNYVRFLQENPKEVEILFNVLIEKSKRHKNLEMQSTNEELTISKEELQSLNEELQTVDIELQRKVKDYIRSNDKSRQHNDLEAQRYTNISNPKQ